MWEILTGEDPYDGMHYGGVIGMLRWNLPSEQGHHTFVADSILCMSMSDLLDANLKYGLSKQLDVTQATTTAFNVDNSYWFHTTRSFLKVFICHLLSHFIDYWCSHYHTTKGIAYIHYIISIKPERRINTPSYKFPLTPFYISLDWEAQVGEMLCLDQFDFQNHLSYHKELPGNIFVWVVNDAKDSLDYVLVFRSQLTCQFQA